MEEIIITCIKNDITILRGLGKIIEGYLLPLYHKTNNRTIYLTFYFPGGVRQFLSIDTAISTINNNLPHIMHIIENMDNDDLYPLCFDFKSIVHIYTEQVRRIWISIITELDRNQQKKIFDLLIDWREFIIFKYHYEISQCMEDFLVNSIICECEYTRFDGDYDGDFC